ncbi:MAG TPA: hypothetical protein VGM32_23135 [Rhodopila sp.]|jgi:hypothetical protein
MLCCGLFALTAAAGFGAWRRLRAFPGPLLALSVALLAASPVVAIATAAPASGGLTQARTWVLAMRSFCGSRHNQPQSINPNPGERP